MSADMPKEGWLVENPELDEDDDHAIIWSPDADMYQECQRTKYTRADRYEKLESALNAAVDRFPTLRRVLIQCGVERDAKSVPMDEDPGNLTLAYMTGYGKNKGDIQERLTAALAVIEVMKLAIGDHHAPADCYSTGPMTGDQITDLILCPACAAVAAVREFEGGKS